MPTTWKRPGVAAPRASSTGTDRHASGARCEWASTPRRGTRPYVAETGGGATDRPAGRADTLVGRERALERRPASPPPHRPSHALRPSARAGPRARHVHGRGDDQRRGRAADRRPRAQRSRADHRRAEIGADAPRPCSFELDEDVERLVVTLPEPVAPGPLTLRLRFRGTLNDKLRGWYRSTFRDDDGREQVIATSQMQATDCRRAFPCWDEPEYKATFAVTMRVSEGLLAISNGPEVSREGEGTGTVTVRFADTMPMSSYLVAFVVGPLEATGPVDVDGVPMRVVHVPGKGHLTGFALDVGAFALRWFQRYYGIPYPSDKVDLVALPDFAAGAMENLGCITFRESVLLVDPASATQTEEQLVADVVAHELAHMWFGDLVTMRWWNGIWLNEAFATFMEVAACDAFRPPWKRWDSFSLERTAAFETDSLLSTRPVEFEVVSPEDADGMFDVLTYQKGGALLRMLEQYLGEEGFRDGIRHYLAKHSYGNTETSDLWDALEATSAEPVRRIMDSWIWQEGYPLVERVDLGRR